MTTVRTERRDVKCLMTWRKTIYLYSDQFFCETNKAWELWQGTEYPRRVKRWPRNRIYIVGLREAKHE